jgi:predicted nucleic acid-binding protein
MMARQKVYIETSVISYLTSRPSRDLIVAGHQQVTQDWWERRSEDFHLVASELVLHEAGAGNEDAAGARLKLLDDLELLAVSEKALELAAALVEPGPLPKNAAEDALHIAISVTNGVDYLLTWNCKHLANAVMRSSIESVCREKGYEPAIICTPEELLEG